MSPLPSIFAALADPTRLAIIARLAEGEAGMKEIGAPFAMSQPAISKHVGVLEAAGLVLRRVDGTRRPCRLAPHALDAIEDWLATLRRTLEAKHSRLDRVLAAMKTREGNAGNPQAEP